jgi:integrase
VGGFLGLGKQAKTLSKSQVEAVYNYVGSLRHGLRNQTMLLLSVRAGFRAKEIAHLRWAMVLGSDGEVAETIKLTNDASKGESGREIPINKGLRSCLIALYGEDRMRRGFDPHTSYVVRTERAARTSPQAVVNTFLRWYHDIGLIGCSSHSGRRTFITNAARKISTVGGSIRDVQMLAGHSSLQTTQRYIEGDVQARIKVVELV